MRAQRLASVETYCSAVRRMSCVIYFHACRPKEEVFDSQHVFNVGRIITELVTAAKAALTLPSPLRRPFSEQYAGGDFIASHVEESSSVPLSSVRANGRISGLHCHERGLRE